MFEVAALAWIKALSVDMADASHQPQTLAPSQRPMPWTSCSSVLIPLRDNERIPRLLPGFSLTLIRHAPISRLFLTVHLIVVDSSVRACSPPVLRILLFTVLTTMPWPVFVLGFACLPVSMGATLTHHAVTLGYSTSGAR